jgi:thiol-disulfide isomerase/thioredoxin
MKTILIKKCFMLIALLWISGQCASQSGDIQFSKNNWALLLSEAKQTGKLIFLDAGASWCGPCKWMKANVFTDDKVGGLYNRNFINASIDMEKGEGIDLRKAFDIKYYPTFLYINGEGEVVHKVIGQSPSGVFMQHALDAMSPERNLNYLDQNYKKRSGDIEFVTTYLKALKNAYELEKCNLVALDYLQKKSSEAWLQSNEWMLIRNYVTDASSSVFQYLVNQQKNFEELYGKRDVETKINNTFRDWPGQYVKYDENGTPVLDEQGFDAYLLQLENSNYISKSEVAANSRLAVYFRLRDWDHYTATIRKMLEEALIPMNASGAELLYSYANNINRFARENKAASTDAVKWARLISEDIKEVQPIRKAVYMDLYANLLESTGNKRLAKQVRKKTDKELLAQAQNSSPMQPLKTVSQKQ